MSFNRRNLETQAHSRRRELLETLDSAPLSCTGPEAEREGRASTPTQAAIIAALQIEVGLQGSAEARALEMSLEFQVREHRLRRAELCPFHDPPGELVPGEDDEPFAEILRRSATAAPRAIALDWPAAVDAHCSACGTAVPAMRVDRLRRSGCPSCGKAVEAGQLLRRIEEDSDWAQRPAGELGLPPRHLYTVESLKAPQ